MQVQLCGVSHAALRRWVDEHGDQARQLQAVQEGRQQAEDRVAELSTQLEQEQQQVAQQKERYELLVSVCCRQALAATHNTLLQVTAFLNTP